MSGLKELVESDRRRTFIALGDFGEEHVIDGVPLACVLDNDTHATRAPELGVESADCRLFAPSEDLGERREAGDVMEIDGSLYAVKAWDEDMGVAEVALSSARAAY